MRKLLPTFALGRTQRALMPPRSNSYRQRLPLSLIAASATVEPREVY